MLLNDLFHKVITPGQTVFDVGAFQGEMTALFSRLTGVSGRVFSFEPHPEHFYKLALSAAQIHDANIFPYCCAISDSVGHCPMYLAPPLTAKASSILPGLGSEARLGPGVQVCLAETDTLDSFIRSHGCVPDVIKIDTEGAERLVIAGGRRSLEVLRPTLIFEGAFGYDDTQKKYCFDEAVPSHVAWLESIGYRMYLIDVDYVNGVWIEERSPLHGSHFGLLSIEVEEFKYLPMTGCNLLAVHGAKSSHVKSIESISTMRLFDYLPGIKRS